MSREDRAARRYLDLLKAALLDEHYLENEVRLEYLYACATGGREPDPVILRDPRRRLRAPLEQLQETRRTGIPVRELAERPVFPYTTIGRSGLDDLHECMEAIRAEAIAGDLAACGVWRGGPAIFMRGFLEAHEIPGTRVFAAGTFAGPPDPALGRDSEPEARRFPTLVADLNLVRDGFARFDLLDDRVRFLQGQLSDALADAPIEELALLYLGEELAETTADALDALYDKLALGGFVIVSGCDLPGCREAVERFRIEKRIDEPAIRVDWGRLAWRKEAAPSSRVRGTGSVARHRELRRAPLAPVIGSKSELSVVVVFHDMRREALRTLHSLSRPYQQGIDNLNYEVIVVENGSAPDLMLDEDYVRSFGPQFRYLDLGSDATPSPAPALNRAIAASRGESVALMIDGAHMLTPGVLRFGMLGLRTYRPAIVMTQQWYLGPGQQPEAMKGGYDQNYEDRLLEEIGWPGAGYRLFEIGSPIGGRDWFDGLWESNCMFAPRALLEQVGGFDESFSMPGGGYVNLDLYERLGASPEVAVVDILGEASFHQLHGGTTTNEPDADELHGRLMAYREHYEQVRKRPFRGPGKRRHYVGRMPDAALRTRPRWNAAKAFQKAQRVGAKGFPDDPIPVPDELRAQFTDAFWRSLTWRETTWLGRRVQQSASDLVAYQALITSIRPDWIIEVPTAGTGRALFLASICDLVNSGQVLSIQIRERGERSEHPRLSYLTGDPTVEDTRRQVFEVVGDGAKALVLIGTAPKARVISEFTAYAPLVPVGSYVVVENTILGGNPVMPEFGPGPGDAIKTILSQRNDFAPDRTLERHGVSFNPRGYLKRVEP